ncbi:MAG: hypothetical protein HOO96_11260 [Polyangiaceae bacterium]|nr:hypothetical protein [Polyangiaceae bacterium]
MTYRACLLVSLLALGCSSSPASVAPGGDAGVDASSCAQGSLVKGACEGALTVAASDQTIAPARDHHTTFIRQTSQGPYLYVVGGTSAWNAMYTDIQRAKIQEDGSLLAFEKVADLPDGRAGHSTIVVGDTLIVIGGVYGTASPKGTTRSTVTAKFSPDGGLSGFAPGPDLPLDVMHFSATLHDGFVYVFGGRTTTGTDGSTTMAASAKVAEDGTLGPFTALAPLTPDRSHHAAFVVKDTLYLVGGITGSPMGNPPSRTDVVRAKLLPGGAIAAFEPSGTLPTGISVSAAQTYGDYVYIFGGLVDGVSGGPYTNQIFRARVQPDGALSPFTTIDATLSVKRAHVHQTPVYKKFIYSVGGLGNNGKSIGTIDVGTFD